MTKQWRKLHFSIWDSSQVMRLPLQARILYFYMVTSADDFGRFKADAAILRKAFPYDDFIAEQIANWRLTIEKSGLIKTYEKENELFAYHPKWKKYQGGRQPAVRPDKKTPKFPPPNNNQTTSGQQPNNNEMTQIRIEESRVEKSRGEESRKEKNNIPAGASKKPWGEISERVITEINKTFKGISTNVIPAKSFFFGMVKKYGENELIDVLGRLRESKNFKEIREYKSYIHAILKAK